MNMKTEKPSIRATLPRNMSYKVLIALVLGYVAIVNATPEAPVTSWEGDMAHRAREVYRTQATGVDL